MNQQGKAIIVSAPSGAGKSTIVRAILEEHPELEFSISACSRPPRGQEIDGVDYFFLNEATFQQRIQAGDFFEWEEVYAGMYYGTLHAELDRIWSKGATVIFDVDVVGGLKIKQLLKERACAIFIKPPSLTALKERLEKRQTDSQEKIEMRIAKAEEEMALASGFDHVVLNDELPLAIQEVEQLIRDFIKA
ncbi:MAG: guanylate kinase [Bacteroidota bacterium]|jgi:guanylate kinase